MKLFKAVATVGGLTLLSRLVGFVRDIMTAAFLGAGPIADAFFVALKLPNFFRRVTAEGAFSVAFVPQYSGTLEKKGPKQARRYAERTMAMMLAIMMPFTVIAILAMPWVIYGVAPGFADEPVRYNLAVELSRVTFPYILLMSLVALLGGILNSIDRFAPFAAAPIFFNICIIGSLVFLEPVMATPGHAMAWGIAFSGVVQLIWMIVFCVRAGVMPKLQMPKMTVDMKKLFKLMGPAVIGAGVVQINIFIDIVIASFLPTGAISYLYYADRLNQLPLAVIGIAIATAMLPMLARAVKAKNKKRTNELFNKSLEFSLILTLPAAAALMVLPIPILSVLFERGAFDHVATEASAFALAAYAMGLPAYVLIKVVNSTFYAHENTMTPVKAAITGTIVNTCLSLALVWHLGHVGIALATGIAGWVQFVIISRKLKKHKLIKLNDGFVVTVFKTLGCVLGMCIALMIGTLFLMDNMTVGTTVEKVASLILLISIGKCTYAALIHITGVLKLEEIKELLKKPKPQRKPRKKKT